MTVHWSSQFHASRRCSRRGSVLLMLSWGRALRSPGSGACPRSSRFARLVRVLTVPVSMGMFTCVWKHCRTFLPNLHFPRASLRCGCLHLISSLQRSTRSRNTRRRVHRSHTLPWPWDECPREWKCTCKCRCSCKCKCSCRCRCSYRCSCRCSCRCSSSGSGSGSSRYSSGSSNSSRSRSRSSSRSSSSSSSSSTSISTGTSSTAQGGGGSFKNRKPIGEVGCCESGMAERSHWWTERCFSSLSLSFSLFLWLSTYLSIYLLCIYLSIDRSIYLSLSFI